jgi:hypothetical protein
MKKKEKPIHKKKPQTTSKIKEKTKTDKMIKKVVVGEDEFCPTCMEWRAYDEATGKCTVCGRLIKKSGARARTIVDEYDLKDFTVEHDEQQDTGEY